MTDDGRQNEGFREIWVLAAHREGVVEEETFGLLAEARGLISTWGGEGQVTALVLGSGLEGALEALAAHGADRILCLEHEALDRYHGELFARILFERALQYRPSFILAAQDALSSDLCPRLAALLGTALVTRAVDLKIDGDGKAAAFRPVANGYLFEKCLVHDKEPPIICFSPAVLTPAEPDPRPEAEILIERPDLPLDPLKTKVVKVLQADPKVLNIEEADIVVTGGRGAGKGESFKLIHELAEALGGSVGGSRPVIDLGILPFDRQIGQTGKSVAPRLLFACGISGANEFTAGMEKSHLVIAVNTDPHARIFRFADLAVIGDLHEVLPDLIEGLKKAREKK